MQRFGKAIGNASRYSIIQALMKGQMSVSELVLTVKQSQPAVSQHLKTLKESGLVTDTRRGKEVLYSIDTKHMLTLLTALSKDVERCRKKS